MQIATAHPDAALDVLARRYAAAVDHRDREALLSVFAPDAVLSVVRPGEETRRREGPEQIGEITTVVARWARTYHLVGQSLYEIDGAEARGEVYCVAHHFDSAELGAGTDHVMYIRYEDDYRAGDDGRWRIAHRRVHVDATEQRPVHVQGASA